MADRKTSVDEMYANRHRPYGQARDPGARHRVEHEPNMRPGDERPPPSPTRPRDPQAPQMPEDQHDNRGGHYDNQVSANSWIRGGGKGGATGKPGFDFGASYRRKDGGNDWHSQTGPDKVEFVKPEPVTTNKQQRQND